MTDSSPILPDVKATLPPLSPIRGTHVVLRPLQPTDTDELFTTIGGASNINIWRYMPDGPFSDLSALSANILRKSNSRAPNPLFFAVIDPTTPDHPVVGHVSFMRPDLANRVIELGFIIFSSSVHRSRLTTETIYLMLRTVFDLGFRRCEWKCDDRNEPSKRAARRFGFVFEGVFRQHMIVKGRNRDTAWFAIVDGEWEGRKRALEEWLDEANFEGGRQKRRLEDIRERQ